MSTEITLSLKETNRLLRYKLSQEQLLGSIRPGSSHGGSSPAVFDAEQTHTYTISPGPESCQRWGTADVCKRDTAVYEETEGQHGQHEGSSLRFAEFSVRKGER